MLGFSAISEVPISQATTSSIALGFLASNILNTTANTVLFDAQSNITTSSALSTFSAGTLAFNARAFKTLDSSISNTHVEALLFDAKSNVVTPSTTALFNLGINFSADSNIIISTTSSNFSISDIDFDAKANITTNSVSVSSAFNNLNTIAKATITPSAVTSVFNLDIDFDAKANILTGSTELVTALNVFDNVSGLANITPTPVSSIGFVNLEAARGLANVDLTSIHSEFDTGLFVPTGVKFDYESIADSYERSRVIYLTGFNRDKKAYIAPEDTTVYIVDYFENRTVQVQAENRTIVIDNILNNNVVYIAA